MNKISGIETDSLQGISIYHDELHEGVLSIQVDNKSKPDFSIRTSQNSTILEGNELILDFKSIKIKNMYDIDNNVVTISRNGTVHVTHTYEWIYFSIGMFVSAIIYFT